MAPEYMEEEFASKFTNLVNMTCERQMYLLMQSLEQIVANVLLVIVELSFIMKFHHQLDKQSLLLILINRSANFLIHYLTLFKSGHMYYDLYTEQRSS